MAAWDGEVPGSPGRRLSRRPHAEAYGLQRYRSTAIWSDQGTRPGSSARDPAATLIHPPRVPRITGAPINDFPGRRAWVVSDKTREGGTPVRRSNSVLVLPGRGRRVAGDERRHLPLGLLDVRDVVELDLTVLTGRLDDERAAAEHPIQDRVVPEGDVV